MKVLSIVVDEIPFWCGECMFAHHIPNSETVSCNATDVIRIYPWSSISKECPLVLETKVQELKDHQCAFSPKCGFRNWSEKK